MPRSVFCLLAAALLCLCARSPARADTQLGIQIITLSGTHFEPKGNVSGSAIGGFIRLDQRWQRFALHLEGFPSVGTADVDTFGGPARASIGLLSATARFRLDQSGHVWAGAGTQVMAQQTPQVHRALVDASRLAGSRIELIGTFPVSPTNFIETEIATMPHLSGIVHETKFAPIALAYSVSAPETASMMDMSIALGMRRGNFTYLFGARNINFAAKFSDGREADRNVGSGFLAEARFKI